MLDKKTRPKVAKILYTLLYDGPTGARYREFLDRMISVEDIDRILTTLKSVNCVELENETHKYLITKIGLSLYQSIKDERFDRKEIIVLSRVYKTIWKQWQNTKPNRYIISMLKTQRKVLQIIRTNNGISIDMISKKTGIAVPEVIDICEHFAKHDAVRLAKMVGKGNEMYFATDGAIDYSKELVELLRMTRKRNLNENLESFRKILFTRKRNVKWRVQSGDRSFEVEGEY